MTTLSEQVAGFEADGYEIVQQGRVLKPPALGLSFVDRVEGFRIGMLGAYPAPTYRSQFDNRLLDDAERWVHLRRPRMADFDYGEKPVAHA